MNYAQCKFKNRASQEVYSAWIPQEKAKIGALLRLKMDGEWRGGWEVTEIGTIKSKDFIDMKKQFNKSFGGSIS